VELDLEGCALVDTVKVEEAFLSVRGRNGMSPSVSQKLVEAVQLYRGDLLEGWNLTWCSYERDRFREMYLALLDKLVAHYEANGNYETGIAFSTLALQCDRARERTHRHMMRLQYLSGDRTGALRQYERCVSMLREELEIAPSSETQELYRVMCLGAEINGTANGSAQVGTLADPETRMPSAPLVLHSRSGVPRNRNPRPASRYARSPSIERPLV
jgi:two-component SAPR family response regulator